MIRMASAVALACLLFAAVPAVSQAAPIAPLPAGFAAGNVTPVHYYYHHWHHWHHHHCWWHHGYRHCGW